MHTTFFALKPLDPASSFELQLHMCPEAIMDLLIDDSEDEAKATLSLLDLAS